MPGLASTDDIPLIHLWDRLLQQEVTMLNLLQNSRINLKLFSESQLNGHLKYDATPMAPLGINVIIHEKTQQHGT